jgi:hypothetical protein
MTESNQLCTVSGWLGYRAFCLITQSVVIAVAGVRVKKPDQTEL